MILFVLSRCPEGLPCALHGLVSLQGPMAMRCMCTTLSPSAALLGYQTTKTMSMQW